MKNNLDELYFNGKKYCYVEFSLASLKAADVSISSLDFNKETFLKLDHAHANWLRDQEGNVFWRYFWAMSIDWLLAQPNLCGSPPEYLTPKYGITKEMLLHGVKIAKIHEISFFAKDDIDAQHRVAIVDQYQDVNEVLGFAVDHTQTAQ